MKTTNALIYNAFLFSLAVSCSNEKESPKPNILFIAVDDLRPELGCYDHPVVQSPNLDQLASEGAMFTRAYCNIPVCGASRASLMTGSRPTRNRFLHYYTRIDLERDTVPTVYEHFKNNGYYTISNGKVVHHFQTDAIEGWDEIWMANSLGGWRDYVVPENIEMNKSQRGVPYEMANVPDTAYRDGKIAAKAISDLRRLKDKDQPFFLACGFLKPHLPFNAPKKYWDLYSKEDIKLPDNNYKPEGAPDAAMHNWGELRSYYGIPKEGPLTDEMAKTLIHGYYACVSYTDAQIGKILAELENLGLRENTVVIVWGDHGWNLREHGLWCKHCNFNTSLNAPIIVSAPGKKQDVKVDAITEFVDIYPTLCDLAGLEKPTHLEGASFAHLLDNPDAESDGIAVCKWFDGVTVIKDNYFYTEWADDNDSIYTRMLYDHANDPDENVNISEKQENQQLVNELSNLIREHRGEDFFKEVNAVYSQSDK